MPALVFSGARSEHSDLPEIYVVTTSVTHLQMRISNVTISGLIYDASFDSPLSFRLHVDPNFAVNYLQTFHL